MDTREIPGRVFEHLLAAFARHWAHWQLEALQRQGYRPGPPQAVNPGDPFGTVLAWLWSQDRDEAAEFVAEYMAWLRIHDELVDPEARVKFDDVLGSLFLAMPEGFDTDALVAYLSGRVPRYYGDSDLNS
jgi:hypothetical protein